MNVSDMLRDALHDEAAAVAVAPDPERLDGALRGADRRRRRRAAVGGGLLAALVVTGAVAGAGVLDDGRGAIVTRPADGGPIPVAPTIPVTTTPVPAPEPPADPAPVEPVTEGPGAAVAVAPVRAADGAQPAPEPVAPPAPAADPAPAPTLTAAAAFGSCGEDPPYDDYSGTAAPGATVILSSPYSSPVSVTADGQGHWAVRVTFPGAPVGTAFSVTASTPGAPSVVLGFVRTA